MCEHRKLFFSRKAKEESKAMCEELAGTLKAMGWVSGVEVKPNGLSRVVAYIEYEADLTMPEE